MGETAWNYIKYINFMKTGWYFVGRNKDDWKVLVIVGYFLAIWVFLTVVVYICKYGCEDSEEENPEATSNVHTHTFHTESLLTDNYSNVFADFHNTDHQNTSNSYERSPLQRSRQNSNSRQPTPSAPLHSSTSSPQHAQSASEDLPPSYEEIMRNKM